MSKLLQAIFLISLMVGVIYLGNLILNETGNGQIQTAAQQKNQENKDVTNAVKADEQKMPKQLGQAHQKATPEIEKNHAQQSIADAANRKTENNLAVKVDDQNKQHSKVSPIDAEDEKLTREILEFDFKEDRGRKEPELMAHKMITANNALGELEEKQPIDLESVGEIMQLYSKTAETLDIK